MTLGSERAGGGRPQERGEAFFVANLCVWHLSNSSYGSNCEWLEARREINSMNAFMSLSVEIENDWKAALQVDRRNIAMQEEQIAADFSQQFGLSKLANSFPHLPALPA